MAKNVFKESDLNFQFLVWEISAKFEKKYGGLFETHSFTNSRFTDEDGDIHDIRSLGNLLKARGKNNFKNTFFFIHKKRSFIQTFSYRSHLDFFSSTRFYQITLVCYAFCWK